MTRATLLLLLCLALACRPSRAPESLAPAAASRDSAELAAMVAVRERAMIARDVEAIAGQFADDVTWMTGGGRFIEGKASVVEFHRGMMRNDSLDYRYRAGRARVRVLDTDDALVYYPWQMLWTSRAAPVDTALNELGIMTLTARRRAGAWRWVAVTNQRTLVFYDSIAPRP